MVEQQSAEMIAISAYGRRFVSEAIAALICSGGLACVIYQSMLRDAAAGKAAYVAGQAAYFEEALSPPNAASRIIYVMMVGLFLFAYEVISLGIYMLIRARQR